MKKRRMKLRFKLLLLAVFLVYTGFAIYGQQEHITKLQAQQQVLDQRAQQMKTELERLEHKSEYMSTDAYVENTAREKFGLTYENEIIIETEDD